ncbi:O-phosphoserine--tRNA ligase [Methanohalophilus sp.]|uniref:O-phosphoserine--tRNA ligase n=1 Tax=Methanohalophilus sp. TaxID=1966352 RepID=UPI00260A61C8|nr:O-phosphoserine--tRNA ligase [Methanohalophilus sp.]MDK2892178.1 O-phosphoseryl-tRNA synthetase [Methanohalophilus sp.]
MKFDPSSIKKQAEEDFDRAWNETASYVKFPILNERYPQVSLKYGKPHPVYDTISKLREAYLRMGFEEIMNPLIVDETEVHKQFGPESLAVLDRCFYLAGLPRPNVGISDERIAKIKEMIGDIGDEGIRIIREKLHAYKKGTIEGDDLVSEISGELGLSDSLIAEMIKEIFPEFKELKPIAGSKTLRSHMTSGWFISLSEMLKRREPPFHLFSIDRCFRREQQEDASRLMTYYSASCVIMDENVTVDYGKAVSEGLLSQFGFEKFLFRPDEKRSKYYTPETQIEVFAYHPKLVGSNTKYSDGWIEIATFGIYSPLALSNYDIPYPVMNLGLGVERLAMILFDATDLRSMSYPQITQYSEWELSDSDLAKMISIAETPQTAEGEEIVKAIVSEAELHGNEPSPCEFVAWEGEMMGKKVKVTVIEPEENTKLCGPAAFNEVLAYNNDILGLPNTKKWKKAFDNHAARTGIRFIDALASKAAREIEVAIEKGLSETETRARIIKTPAEINISLSPLAQRFITGKNKKIDIRGPVFTTIRAEIK